MYVRVCIHICGPCQPLGSFTINIPRMTGKITKRAVCSGQSSVLVPKCQTNPFHEPKLHKCVKSLLSAGSLSRKPEWGEFGESSPPSGLANKPVWNTPDNHLDIHHHSHQVTLTHHRNRSWKLQSPPSHLECTRNTWRCVFTFQFRKLLTTPESS